MPEVERHKYDVVVIGAGGAGLRAVIEAREHGLSVAVVCKSLFGKAHTVMAEGGCAASMGNANEKDNWQTHFRDTMRGGKFLNNWRMAELHAQEAPDRVWELETYGALFDRTPDGRISQRNFGGHTYPRLAHVGDRTGLEIIRTMQQKIVSLQQEDYAATGDYEARIKVFAECTITDLLKDGDAISGAFGYWRESGRFVLFETPAVVLATGGVGKSYKVTSNSWEYTGDGHALALRAGASLINMEFLQFHPTGMVWPPSVKGILVTEGVRGDGGVLKNTEGKRFMFEYIPAVFKGQYTAALTLLVVPLQTVLGFAVAALLVRRRAGGAFRVLFALPWMCAPVAVGVIWRWLFAPTDGALNALLGRRIEWLADPALALPSVAAVSIWSNFGYVALFFVAGLRAIPPEIHEAGALDGATGWRRIRWLTLPLLRPTLFFVLVTGTITAFQTFDTVYALTKGGPGDRTNVVAMQIFSEAFDAARPGRAAVMAIVVFGIMLAITVLQHRYFRTRTGYEF